MTDREALDQAIAAYSVEHDRAYYEWLCFGQPDLAARRRYLATVHAAARGEPAPAIAVDYRPVVGSSPCGGCP